jgi:hypothetical protein
MVLDSYMYLALMNAETNQRVIQNEWYFNAYLESC